MKDGNGGNADAAIITAHPRQLQEQLDQRCCMQAGAARLDDNLRFYAAVSDGALWPDAWPFSPVRVVYEVKVREGGGQRTHCGFMFTVWG